MIGHIRIDLDAPVHRAGVHHQRIGLGTGQPIEREAIKVAVFARRGDELALHPLLLEAQHHHHIGPGQRGIEIMKRGDAHRLDLGRHQRGGRADAHIGPQRGEAEEIGAGDAAVQDVAADGDGEPGKLAAIAARAQRLADGQRIEQRLRRVLVLAIAGVEHRAIHLARDQPHRAG